MSVSKSKVASRHRVLSITSSNIGIHCRTCCRCYKLTAVHFSQYAWQTARLHRSFLGTPGV